MANKEHVRTTTRETCIVLGLYLLFFAWWYITAYGFGSDPSQYKYVFGFPEWFFYSCIVGYVGISIILWVVIRLFFKEMPLDGEEDKND